MLAAIYIDTMLYSAQSWSRDHNEDCVKHCIIPLSSRIQSMVDDTDNQNAYIVSVALGVARETRE